MSHLLAAPIWEAGSGLSFKSEPPAVAAGQTRYWSLSASQTSQAEKDTWNALGVLKGINFTTSPANPSISDQHYTGMYWTSRHMRYGPSGVFESDYPGFPLNTKWFRINSIWQPGGRSPDLNSAIFIPFSASNNLDAAKNRHFKRNLRYRWGFDFSVIGIEAPDAPKRVTFWKCKTYFDTLSRGFDPPDSFAPDSVPSMGLGSIGAPTSGVHFRVVMFGDSDAITEDISDLEVNDTNWSANPVRDNRIYRVRCEIVYDINSNGEIYVWLQEDDEPEEQIVNFAARTTFLETPATISGEAIATRSPYFGTYITGAGTNTGQLNIKMDNIYVDCDTV